MTDEEILETYREEIDKNINLLQSCLTNQGKIMSRRMTNLTLKQQRQLSKAVKRARILNLLSLEQKKNQYKS